MASPNLFAPRAAETRKSGTLDFADGYSRGMRNWKQSLYEQAVSEVRAGVEYQEIERYIDFLEGRYYDPSRPAYRSQFYDNYMADQRIESLAALSDVKPYIDISCSVPAYKHQGEVAHNYLRHLWHRHRLDLKIVSWLDHALFGTGFMKMTAATPGNFQFSARGLDTVLPVLMSNNELQTSTAVIDKSYQSIGELISRFGFEKCRGLERYAVCLDGKLGSEKYAKPSDVQEYTWNAMSPAMKRRRSRSSGPSRQDAGGGSPFGSIEVMEVYFDDWSINEDPHPKLVKHPDLDTWEHNYHYIVPHGARMWPRKRLIIFAGDRVMYDGPSPMWHGMYPYSMLQLNPCVWSPFGISKYRNLVPLAKAVNRIGAGIDETVMKALNQNVITARGKISEAAWDAFDASKPKQKIMLNPIANPATDFRWMDAPQLPGYVQTWVGYLVDTIKKRSGTLDVTGLSRKKQAPAGEAIEQMRDSMSGPLRLEGRYLEAALEQCGEQSVSNIFQFATLDKRLSVLGADGMTWEDFDYRAGEMKPAGENVEDWWRQFSIQIAPGSLHGASKAQKDQKAFIMAQSGKLSMRGLYRQTEFPEDPDRVMAELKEEHDAGIGVAPQKGRTPRPKQGMKSGRG